MVWYITVQCGVVWYSMVWYGMVWYGMVWYGMVWYGMVWYGMIWNGTVWYNYHNKDTHIINSFLNQKFKMMMIHQSLEDVRHFRKSSNPC